MTQIKRKQAFKTLLIAGFCIALLSGGATTQSASGPMSTTPKASYVRVKSSPVISPAASLAIAERVRDNRVKVWVHFTDKGFTDNAGFAAAASNTAGLTSRAAKRRAKVGRAQMEFSDIPVSSGYIDRIVAMGAKYRRVSRWLNAASFEIDPNQIRTVADLPFVHKIEPVAGYRHAPETIEAPPKGSEGSSSKATGGSSATALNYGASAGQLQQINIPAVHDLGYKGQGVLVCMLDTGYKKDHSAFGPAFGEGRVLAEWDFVKNDGNTQNELNDVSGQHNHGTYTWSTLGGQADGFVYGPAYLADFILGKTEDLGSETPVEEDNWLAAVEWADSIGADVISSSLAYGDWYTYADFNGDIATVTSAADYAASLGIVVCNSNANEGPAAGTLWAPADADSILAVGAVSSTGTIASFSSRGPSSDGRIKPEVCAQGLSTRCATPSDTNTYGFVSGTSLSCPLIGGCAAVALSANPTWTPMMVREAMMMTASQALTPDNTYGWGIVDMLAAINYSFSFVPGDLNYDVAVDVIDIALEINILFFNASPPPLPVSPDINGDGMVSVPDAVFLIDHIFRGGPAPA